MKEHLPDDVEIEEISEDLTEDASLTKSPLTRNKAKLKDGLKSLFKRLFPDTTGESTIGLSLATLGPGILTLPYAFLQSGVILGGLQVFLCTILGYYSMSLLAKCCNATDRYSYSELAYITYGSKFQWFVKFILFLNNWGTLVLYTLIGSNILASVIHLFLDKESLPEYVTTLHSTIWPIIFNSLIVLPLYIMRNFSTLKYSNLLCLALGCYLVFLVIFKNYELGAFVQNIQNIELFNISGLKISLPIIIFNYGGQLNTPTLLRDVQDSTLSSVQKTFKSFLVSAASIYMIIAVFGYLLFIRDPVSLTGTKNMAQALAYEGYLVSAAISMILVCISISFAMVSLINSHKEGLAKTLNKNGYLLERINLSKDIILNKERDDKIKDIGLFAVVIASQVLCAIYFQNATEIMDLLGVITLPLVAYIIPCLLFLKIDKGSLFSPVKLKCMGVNFSVMAMSTIYIYIYATEESELWTR